MKHQDIELNEIVQKALKVGWDGSFPVCSQYIAFRMKYVMRKYAKLKETGVMEDGDTISIGSKLDEKWARMMVAHIMARHVLYKEYNFSSTKEDIMKEDNKKERRIKYYVYEMMIPRDFLYFLLTERKQTNKMILLNTFGVPEEIFDERLEQLGIELSRFRREVFGDDYGSI